MSTSIISNIKTQHVAITFKLLNRWCSIDYETKSKPIKRELERSRSIVGLLSGITNLQSTSPLENFNYCTKNYDFHVIRKFGRDGFDLCRPSKENSLIPNGSISQALLEADLAPQLKVCPEYSNISHFLT